MDGKHLLDRGAEYLSRLIMMLKYGNEGSEYELTLTAADFIEDAKGEFEREGKATAKIEELLEDVKTFAYSLEEGSAGAPMATAVSLYNRTKEV